MQWGGCQLDGLPYLYVVMEYADQTLAQLLQHRALTDEEAREMLRPTLDALAFLHGRNLVQGQLKPANILVVGDQLKLASDTIRRVSEGTMSANAPTCTILRKRGTEAIPLLGISGRSASACSKRSLAVRLRAWANAAKPSCCRPISRRHSETSWPAV